MYVVKGQSVPARTLTLTNLTRSIEELADTGGDCIIPGSGDGKPPRTWAVLARRECIGKVWETYLLRGSHSVRRVLERVSEYLRDVRDKSCYIDSIADVIGYMMRYPLVTDPLAPGENPIYIHSLVALAARIESCRSSKDARASLNHALKAVFGGDEEGEELRRLRELVLEITKNAHSLEASRMLQMIFYTVPADDRPGYNIASFLLVQLMVSGITSSTLATCRDLGDRERAVARIAALLHDAGRPLAGPCIGSLCGKEHTRRIVKELLRGVLGDEELNRVIDIIEQTNGSRIDEADESIVKIAKVIGWARRTVLNLELLKKEIIKIIDEPNIHGSGPLLSKLFQELSGKMKLGNEPIGVIRELYEIEPNREVAESFVKLLEDKDSALLLYKLTEELSKYLSSPSMPREDTAGELGAPPCGTTPLLAVVDLGGVQAGLAEATRMRSLSGYSLLVDYLTLSIVPLALTVVGGALEGVVYSGGGSVQAIVPDSWQTQGSDEEKLAEASSHIGSEVWKLIGTSKTVLAAVGDLKVRVGVARLDSSNYSQVVSQAYARLKEIPRAGRSGKDVVRDRIAYYLARTLYGISKTCDYCGMRPAVSKLYGDDVCLVCLARYQFSKILGYHVAHGKKGVLGYRMRVARQLVSDLDEILDKYVREVFGLEEQYDFDVMGLLSFNANYAVIKSDGNTVGLFMIVSKTPSIYFEKSMRLDMATKHSIHKIISRLQAEAKSNRAVAELLTAMVFGFMYAGGDDSLLIVPARAALPIATALAYLFSAETGFSVTLSTGIAATPKKHNLWWTIDAANELLDEIAKKKAREIAVKAILSAGQAEAAGFAAFDYSDGWGMTSQRVSLRYHYLAEARLTKQPLPIALKPNIPGIDLASVIAFLAEKYQDSLTREVAMPSTVDEDADNENRLLNAVAESVKSRVPESEVAASRAGSSILYDNISEILDIIRKAERSAVMLGTPEGRIRALPISLAYILSRTDIQPRLVRILAKFIHQDSMDAIPIHDIYLLYKFLRGD